jgi:hypothetical protein
MANQIVNAAAMVIEHGTQDLSKRVLPREPEFIPQHLPKFYLYTEKGPIEPQLVVGAERARVFGDETFNLRSKFANHATVFANAINAQGNACMLQRIVPQDIGPEATITVWLDVLPATVDLYERNSDGSIKLDAQGDPIVTTTAPGFKVKWVVSHYADKTALQGFGAQTIKPGDQTNALTSTQSQRYPIFEVKASSLGSVFNLSGLRLWAPTTKSVSSMPSKMMNAHRAYPYFISVIRRPDLQSSPKLVETLFAEQKMMVTFKKDTIDPLTDKELYIGDNFIDAYQNLTDLRYPKQFGEFGDMKVYDANIETLLTMFHNAEKTEIDQFSDFTADAADKHLFNFLTGVTSSNTPYHTFQFVDSVNSVRFSEYTNVYAAGATDGTMTDAAFALSVKNELEVYTDPNHPVQELAVNVESIMYDSGFPLATKLAMADFIAQRKDTFVVLSTHDVNDRILDASEEHALAISLRTRLQMYPESDYFGTPVTRAMIVGRSGLLRNSQFTKHLPLSLEVAIKAAKYMGAGNGRWTNGASFSAAPGSVVQYMTDINVTWVPASVRNRNWDVGLNWVQAYDRKSYFFPALKTIYDDDTSVLNSFFTAMAICQLNKVAHAAWREFSGTDTLTNSQLAQRVNDFVNSRVANRFDDRFVIVPDVQFTDMDLLRGFSWTLPIKIYAPNMKTVMTTYVQAFRKDDLEA